MHEIQSEHWTQCGSSRRLGIPGLSSELLPLRRLCQSVVGEDNTRTDDKFCAAKDETSVDIMRRMCCCNFLRKSRLRQIWLARQ
jgi:hypothetical protein